MAGGVFERLWSMDDRYNAATEHAAHARAKAKRERWIEPLIDRHSAGCDCERDATNDRRVP
jgi:hypothetical protein